MAIGTKQIAFLEFLFDFTPCFDATNLEVFLCWVAMVKFECLDTLAVFAPLTPTALVFYGFPAKVLAVA